MCEIHHRVDYWTRWQSSFPLRAHPNRLLHTTATTRSEVSLEPQRWRICPWCFLVTNCDACAVESFGVRTSSRDESTSCLHTEIQSELKEESQLIKAKKIYSFVSGAPGDEINLMRAAAKIFFFGKCIEIDIKNRHNFIFWVTK